MATTGLTPQRQALPRMDFGDRDLTDTFADVQDDTASSSGQGHPRGSSVVSGITSSRRSTPSQAFSAFSSPTKPLPNFSALLSFLDADTDHGRIVRPKPLSPSANGVQPSSSLSSTSRAKARAEVHLSETPTSQRRSAGANVGDESASPLLSPRHAKTSAGLWTPAAPNGPSAADRMAAALMEGAPTPRWDPKTLQPPATAPPADRRRTREGSEEARRPAHRSYDPRVRPHGERDERGPLAMSGTSDLPRSLLEEVHQEFRNIVSRSTHRANGAHDGSPSGSSDGQEVSHPDDSRDDARPQGDEDGSASGEDPAYDADASSRPAHVLADLSRSTVPARDDEKLALSEALSHAMSDLSSLQLKVDSLKAAVRQLSSGSIDDGVASPADVAVATAKRLDDPTPDNGTDFVRAVDELVWRPGGGLRRDEDIFTKGNMERLANRVQIWAALSRRAELVSHRGKETRR